MAEATKIPEVRQELELAREALTDMMSALDDTEKNLDAVMRPPTPSPDEAANNKKTVPTTPLGLAIRELRDRTVGMTIRLHSFLNRIEV